MKNIRIFIGKLSVFLVVKFSIYLNRRVFVMICDSRSLKCVLEYGLCGLLLLVGVWDVSTDPERINHMPIC